MCGENKNVGLLPIGGIQKIGTDELTNKRKDVTGG